MKMYWLCSMKLSENRQFWLFAVKSKAASSRGEGGWFGHSKNGFLEVDWSLDIALTRSWVHRVQIFCICSCDLISYIQLTCFVLLYYFMPVLLSLHGFLTKSSVFKIFSPSRAAACWHWILHFFAWSYLSSWWSAGHRANKENPVYAMRKIDAQFQSI